MKPWKELERKEIPHSEHRKFADVLYEMPDGHRATFTLALVGDTTNVFALTEKNEVILARQFRPGPGQVFDELPGGLVEPGEDIAESARRELREETGYEAAELVPLGVTYAGAYSTLRRNTFLARGCRRAGAQELDRDERIEVVLKPLPEFIAQVRQGALTDTGAAWAGLLAIGAVNLSI